jgi:hypothetical protein
LGQGTPRAEFSAEFACGWQRFAWQVGWLDLVMVFAHRDGECLREAKVPVSIEYGCELVVFDDLGACHLLGTVHQRDLRKEVHPEQYQLVLT